MPLRKSKKIIRSNATLGFRTTVRKTGQRTIRRNVQRSCQLLPGFVFIAVTADAIAVSAPVLSIAFNNEARGTVASFSATGNPDVDGYNLYSDGSYLNTFSAQPFTVDATEGSYCAVAFERSPGGAVEYSVCSNTVVVSATDLGAADITDGTSSTSESSNSSNQGALNNQINVQPAGLRAQVFSRTALELYWDRSPGETTYTVLRDGQELETTTGTSFWSPGLVQGRTYEFQVLTGSGVSATTFPVTTNNPGQQVAAAGNTAAVSQDTPQDSPQDPPTGALDAGATASLASASALRLEIYSATAAELFWTHAPDIAQLSGYRVFVNGDRVGFTAGTSFFFSQINPDSNPIIEVVAVDPQGDTGAPARLGAPADDARTVSSPVEQTPAVAPAEGVGANQGDLSPISISSLDNQPELLEGNQSPIIVPVSLDRAGDSNFAQALTLTVQALDDQPGSSMRLELSQSRLVAGNQRLQAELRVWLPVGRRPLDFHQRRIRFGVLADNGERLDVNFDVAFNISPVRAPDVYLLAGQSNMVGFSKMAQKQAGPGGEDEPDDRIRQLNVTSNNLSFYENFNDYSAADVIAGSPRLIRAEDPLHELQFPFRSNKGGTFVGPGLSFAKGLLDETTQEIILVPSAWSATGFCRSEIDFPGWSANGGPGDAVGGDFGGSELSDRAVARLNLALSESGGIFRGIIWHQGEADSNSNACASNYAANLRRLVERLRTVPLVDLRGSGARHANAEIPFVVATMSRGNDERGAFSVFSDTKQQVDSVHRLIANEIPFSGFVNADDLVPSAYPCGNSSCVHFGAAAYREMGRRYAEAMKQLWKN